MVAKFLYTVHSKWIPAVRAEQHSRTMQGCIDFLYIGANFLITSEKYKIEKYNKSYYNANLLSPYKPLV